MGGSSCWPMEAPTTWIGPSSRFCWGIMRNSAKNLKSKTTRMIISVLLSAPHVNWQGQEDLSDKCVSLCLMQSWGQCRSAMIILNGREGWSCLCFVFGNCSNFKEDVTINGGCSFFPSYCVSLAWSVELKQAMNCFLNDMCIINRWEKALTCPMRLRYLCVLSSPPKRHMIFGIHVLRTVENSLTRTIPAVAQINGWFSMPGFGRVSCCVLLAHCTMGTRTD